MGDLIAFGTDAGGFAWTENPAQEFAYYVRYGMTPMQAIRTATTNAAGSLGREKDVGTVAAGKLADLVAVEGDPSPTGRPDESEVGHERRGGHTVVVILSRQAKNPRFPKAGPIGR